MGSIVCSEFKIEATRVVAVVAEGIELEYKRVSSDKSWILLSLLNTEILSNKTPGSLFKEFSKCFKESIIILYGKPILKIMEI